MTTLLENYNQNPKMEYYAMITYPNHFKRKYIQGVKIPIFHFKGKTTS